VFVGAASGCALKNSAWWFHQLEEFFAPNGYHSIGLQSPHIEEIARLAPFKFWDFSWLKPIFQCSQIICLTNLNVQCHTLIIRAPKCL
jgi:hypothetical protein